MEDGEYIYINESESLSLKGLKLGDVVKIENYSKNTKLRYFITHNNKRFLYVIIPSKSNNLFMLKSIYRNNKIDDILS